MKRFCLALLASILIVGVAVVAGSGEQTHAAERGYSGQGDFYAAPAMLAEIGGLVNSPAPSVNAVVASISVTKQAIAGPFGESVTVICNGRNVTMRYVVRNTGDQILNNINVDDTDPALGHIAGPFSLNPGQSATFNVVRTISGSVSGTVTAAGTDASSGSTVSSMASLTVNGVVCGVTVTKTPDFPSICNPQLVQWTITITNNSPVFIWEGRFDDSRFGRLDPFPINSTPGDLFKLDPLQTKTYQKSEFLDLSDFVNGIVTNTATAVGETGNDATPASHSASATVNLLSCGTIGGVKFFDINANGLQDAGDFELAGFRIRTTFDPALSSEANDVLRLTQNDGTWSITGIPENTNYLVREDVPAACDLEGLPLTGYSWVQTAPPTINVTSPFPVQQLRGYQGILTADDTDLDFGNRCQAPGTGGKTLGFWSNKNGQALITAADLTFLSGLNLVNANGTAFDNFSKTQFRSWLLNGSATNMAYMLSVQMSATVLNARHGFINGNALIDVGGQIGTINGWITEADTSLGTFPVTTIPHPERANQERLKNIFDGINNNNFVFINLECRACAYAE